MKNWSFVVNKHLVSFFTASALIALVIFTSLTLYVTDTLINQAIIKTTEESNATVTKLFVNEVYPDVQSQLKLTTKGQAEPLSGMSLDVVDQKVRDFTRNTDILKVKIYDVSGITIYSTVHSELGADKSGNSGWQAGLSGELFSKLTHRGKFSAVEGEVFNRDLVATYVPIRVDGDQIVGVTELYTDRSSSIEKSKAVFSTLTVFLPFISSLIFFMLLAIVWYAEKERKHQNKALDDINSQLSVAKEKALKASEAKSEFLAVMSHEIRTPLNGVIGTLSLVELQDLSSESRDLIHTALNSSELLTSVINDILDYSKIESGKFELHTQTMSLEKLIRQVFKTYQSMLEDKGLDFSVELQGIDDLSVEADAVRIKQILNNYVNNAYNFTEQGSIKLSVTRLPDKRFKFAVSDTGIGVSEEAQSLLFKDFSQIDHGTTRSYGGSGLGLFICKRLSELMGGEVGVDSVLGEGSTFFAVLPLQEVQPKKIVQAKPLTQSGTVSDKQSKHLLVVEDNKVNQLVATKLLDFLGYSYDICEDGKQCLDFVAHQPVDLILMDCQMPVMDGFEATRRLREMNVETTIVALTANAQESDKKQCIDAGMDGFLSKPFNVEQLDAILTKYLSQ